MSAIALSTAGIQVAYAVEATAGTKPTTFKEIPRAMSLPSVNPSPSTIEVTPLSATNFKEYVAGLQDVGGSLAIKFSLTDGFQKVWEDVVRDYKTAAENGRETWFEFYIPDMKKAFFTTAEPTELGFGGAEVDSHLEIEAYITPQQIKGWDTAVKPTPYVAAD